MKIGFIGVFLFFISFVPYAGAQEEFDAPVMGDDSDPFFDEPAPPSGSNDGMKGDDSLRNSNNSGNMADENKGTPFFPGGRDQENSFNPKNGMNSGMGYDGSSGSGAKKGKIQFHLVNPGNPRYLNKSDGGHGSREEGKLPQRMERGKESQDNYLDD